MRPKGSRKNKFAELALRFGSDLADPIEQTRRNSELFRGVCPPPAEGSVKDGLKSQIRRLSGGLRCQNVKLFLREP